jgi:hypothetical protein
LSHLQLQTPLLLALLSLLTLLPARLVLLPVLSAAAALLLAALLSPLELAALLPLLPASAASTAAPLLGSARATPAKPAAALVHAAANIRAAGVDSHIDTAAPARIKLLRTEIHRGNDYHCRGEQCGPVLHIFHP